MKRKQHPNVNSYLATASSATTDGVGGRVMGRDGGQEKNEIFLSGNRPVDESRVDTRVITKAEEEDKHLDKDPGWTIDRKPVPK